MTNDSFLSWLSIAPRRVLVMGILNVTPDSFSDGGQFLGRAAAEDHARRMIDEGADLIDVGGESTKPGSQPVPAAEQIWRVVPAIEFLAKQGIAVSIDTTQSVVAVAALDAGACLVNDISAGRGDAAMFALCAARGVPIVLMHMQGTPATMQLAPAYDDVTAEVKSFLLDRAAAAQAAGIPAGRILLDPGIGFGKSFEHNLTLLRRLDELTALAYPLLLGVSRKGFIGTLTNAPAAADRLPGTAAAVAHCVAHGAAIVRVHDVAAMRAVVNVSTALVLPPLLV